MTISLQARRIALLALGLLTAVRGMAISEQNVLVVYNSESSDSQAVYDYYVSLRPNILGYDLDDATIVTSTVSYADFASKIRTPIRNHLDTNNLEQTVQVIVLTKDIPHRIQSIDTNNAGVGDTGLGGAGVYNDGNATYASVDSELVLLQHDLETGENGGSFDSPADNAVLNPYFNETSGFSSFSRSSIASSNLLFSKNGNAYSWWELGRKTGRFFTPSTPGDIYLTARLDADTVQDVKDMIDRAQVIALRSDIDAILLDSDGREDRLDTFGAPDNAFNQINDYQNGNSLMSSSWGQVLWNDDATFLIGKAASISLEDTQTYRGPIAYLHSYGVNHTGNGNQIRPYLLTFDGQLVPGACFAAYESFGARGLGGLGNNNQGQVEEWIASGGTFAIGPVWEPFTFGISKSEQFLDNFFNRGLTFVEAAWSSILQISWQSVVIGDPLATATITTAAPYSKWVFDTAGSAPDTEPEFAFDADFDLDGNANGFEYVLGLDPENADLDSNRLPQFQYLGSTRSFDFILETENANQTELRLQSSQTLQFDDWTTLATRTEATGWTGTATVQETTDGVTKIVNATDNTADTGKRFYRLSITEVSE